MHPPHHPRPLAGKSTVIRCLASAALLASCGLCVPARSARLPLYSSVVLRNFSEDAPKEGRSSFMVEMQVGVLCVGWGVCNGLGTGG